MSDPAGGSCWAIRSCGTVSLKRDSVVTLTDSPSSASAVRASSTDRPTRSGTAVVSARIVAVGAPPDATGGTGFSATPPEAAGVATRSSPRPSLEPKPRVGKPSGRPSENREPITISVISASSTAAPVAHVPHPTSLRCPSPASAIAGAIRGASGEWAAAAWLLAWLGAGRPVGADQTGPLAGGGPLRCSGWGRLGEVDRQGGRRVPRRAGAASRSGRVAGRDHGGRWTFRRCGDGWRDGSASSPTASRRTHRPSGSGGSGSSPAP